MGQAEALALAGLCKEARELFEAVESRGHQPMTDRQLRDVRQALRNCVERRQAEAPE